MCRGIALVLSLAACTGDAGLDYRMTLEVRDAGIRTPGTECAGSRPFLFVHRDAPYRVEEATSGEEIASGELPPGTAVEAFPEDLEVPRVPTFCRFRFTVALPRAGDYRLVLEEGEPLEFSAGRESRDVTLVLS